MFWFTSVQLLSVVNIAPGSGGAGSALGARYNPAAITAVNVNNLKVGFILILGFTFISFLFGGVCSRPRHRTPRTSNLPRALYGTAYWNTTYYGFLRPKFRKKMKF